MNRILFAFALQLRPRPDPHPPPGGQHARTRPHVWFNNVERIAGERVGRETVQYVSNVYKYYVAYTLTLQDCIPQARPARAAPCADRPVSGGRRGVLHSLDFFRPG